MSTPLDAATGLTATQGTWTPTLAYATPGTSSFTTGTRTGTYTKIGTLVLFQYSISVTPTNGTASGDLLIGGLPFPIFDYIFGQSPPTVNGIVFPAGTYYLLPFVNSGAGKMYFIAQGPNGAIGIIGASQVTSGGSLTVMGAGQYHAAS